MRLIHISLLAGTAVLGLSAFALAAGANDSTIHKMTIQLPGGASETIEYTGGVTPKVLFDRQPPLLAWSAPIAFAFEPSFAAFDSVVANVDRQMESFWRQVDTVAHWPQTEDFNQIELQNLGPGVSAYAVVSESLGNNFCSRVTEITTSPIGGRPKVVSRTSGNCNGGTMTSAPNSPSGV